jgi:hypothetical protein
VKIGAQQLGDEVAKWMSVACMEILPIIGTNMSSRGEMKMSLRLMTCETESDGLFERKSFPIHTFSCLKCFRSFNSR